MEGGTVRSLVTPSFDGSKIGVYAMRFDRDGNLWVGTLDKGVFRLHGNVVDQYARAAGLSSDFVRAFFEDREGIVWATTNNGVDQFHDPRVAIFSTAEGLSKDWAVGVLASTDGTIWVANAESLDHIVNGNVTSIRQGHGLPGEQTTSMLEDSAGNLWVGGIDDGLYLFKNGRFRRLPEPNHQPLGLVVGLIQRHRGRYLGRVRRHGKACTYPGDFQVQEEFSRAQVPTGRIAPSPQGGIWIGTRDGQLALLRHGALQKFQLTPDAKNPFTNQIVAQADGFVLAAFDDGLVGFQKRYSTAAHDKKWLALQRSHVFH